MVMDISVKFALLVVDDEEYILSSIKRMFKRDDYLIYLAQSGDEALWILERTRIDAAIVDLKMPGMDGLTLLAQIRKRFVLTRVLMLTGHGGVQEAVKAMALGAVDFIEKPIAADVLHGRIKQIAEQWQQTSEHRRRRHELDRQYQFSELIGESPPMLEVKEMVARVADTDASVMIQGESGTGKELVALAIHFNSSRHVKNFVPVDCASLGEGLIQSELFGHTRGAFTGALSAHAGLIRHAHEGTLFLDEIGEMDLTLQARLLRTLQQRVVRPVGSNQEYKVDIRVISATNRQLTQEIAAGHFREDLYYRLNTISIELPPLRRRREDIPMLVDFFIKKNHNSSKQITGIDDDALACLCAYDWPGNVRELANIVFRAVVLSRHAVICPDALPAELLNRVADDSAPDQPVTGDTLDKYEQFAIESALAKVGNNRRRAAEILGIGEATLYRKLKKYHLN